MVKLYNLIVIIVINKSFLIFVQILLAKAIDQHKVVSNFLFEGLLVCLLEPICHLLRSDMLADIRKSIRESLHQKHVKIVWVWLIGRLIGCDWIEDDVLSCNVNQNVKYFRLNFQAWLVESVCHDIQNIS